MLGKAGVALAVGLAVWFLASFYIERLCRTEKLNYHSRLGYTFLWRLKFLQELPQTAQAAFLDEISSRVTAPDQRRVVAVFRDNLEKRGAFEPSEVQAGLAAALYPQGGPVDWNYLDTLLNAVAWASFMPPTPEHFRAFRTDLRHAEQVRLPEISGFLFATTGYLMRRREQMIEGKDLVTFRDWTPPALEAIPTQRPFFGGWRSVSYRQCLGAWLLGMLGALILGWQNERVVSASALSIALVGVGILMVAITCFIGELLPRYVFPMWETLWIAGVLGIGALGNVLQSRFLPPQKDGRAAVQTKTRYPIAVR